jgi:hypothetical protein
MIKKYTVASPDGTKEYVVEFSDEEDKISKLSVFLTSLDFLRESEEFTTAQLQRFLKCAYGTVCKVIDALCLLCVIEMVENSQSSGGRKYRRFISIL